MPDELRPRHLVTSAPNFFALVLVGIGVFAGILAGRGGAVLTLVPALITAFAILVVALTPRLLRAPRERGGSGNGDDWRSRMRHMLRGWLTAGADGVEQAIVLLRGHSFGVIVGSFAYMAFDIAALGFAFAAVGT